MIEVEKNDVDISKLFNWGRVFKVENQATKETEALVYMRILGDADSNKARVFALRKSGELRKKMVDVNSDESFALFRQYDEIESQDCINYICLFSVREITNQAYKNIKVKQPSKPRSDASLERMEKYQEEVDAYPGKVREAIEQYIKKELDKVRDFSAKENKESLYKKYKRLVTDEFCEQEAQRAYNDMQIYLGCYRDDTYTDKFFNSFEEYENLDSGVKADFRIAYSSIEVSTDELKKLRGATQ